MTPTHQKLIDQLLQSADRRVRELLTGSGYQVGRELRIEELRKSPLGQHLANLANYSEGYAVADGIRDIRGSAQYVHTRPTHPIHILAVTSGRCFLLFSQDGSWESIRQGISFSDRPDDWENEIKEGVWILSLVQIIGSNSFF